MPNQYFKNVESPVANREELHTLKSIDQDQLAYTLCDRTNTNSKEANYFSSFNLPHIKSELDKSSALAQTKPELYQLNVDEIVVCSIPKESYNDYIDGRSITFQVPQVSGVPSENQVSAKTVVSSSYSKLEKKQDNALLGSNIAFLFSDDINKPYTGTTQGGSFSKSDNTTWNPNTSYINRPVATSYSDLNTSVDVNSDSRNFSDVKLAVSVTESYPTNTNSGYNYDIPIGFVALDKGWVIFTHPDIVNNIPWSAGNKLSTNTANSGPNPETKDIYFTDPTKSSLEYVDIRVDFKTSIVALVYPREFYFTNNPSWDRAKNYQEQQSGEHGYDPVAITEIGLYNQKNEMIAIAKFDRPYVKSYSELITFTLDINV